MAPDAAAAAAVAAAAAAAAVAAAAALGAAADPDQLLLLLLHLPLLLANALVAQQAHVAVQGLLVRPQVQPEENITRDRRGKEMKQERRGPPGHYIANRQQDRTRRRSSTALSGLKGGAEREGKEREAEDGRDNMTLGYRAGNNQGTRTCDNRVKLKEEGER